MKWYGLKLKKTGEKLGFSYSDNFGSEFCNPVSFQLEVSYDTTWLVKRRELAEEAANTDNDWYNAGYDRPQNSFAGQCEVYEIDIP